MTGRSPGSPPRSSQLREDRGAATAETAVVLPIIVALMMVIAVAGAGLSLQLRLEGAARAAARELARGESSAAARETAVRTGGSGTEVSVAGDGTWVRVEAHRTLHGPGGLLGGATWTLHADAEARLEPQLLGPDRPAVQGAGLPLLLAVHGRRPGIARPRRTRTGRGPRTGDRPPPRRPHRRGQEGSAPAAVTAWIGMAVTVIGAVSLLGLGLCAQARADTAADLAALGAADALTAGTGDPCTVAAEVARRNDAVLVSCMVEGLDVVVTAGTEAGSLPQIVGRARAGPAPLQEATSTVPRGSGPAPPGAGP
ncbi:Rv3654c family TadE-like protein [Brachybacterium hainanense]|uniref:Rv3654c family TadE-like protein n=1 Tax=Brachybacterium hainanense TaxID=1541174 RepID=A0ABV6RF23_9MICO